MRLSEIILGILEKSARESGELLDIFFSGYADSYRKARRRILSPTAPEFTKINYAEIKRKEKNNFYSLLSQLQKQGLVEKRTHKGKNTWKITHAGLIKLDILKQKIFANKKYKTNREKHIKIVIFDIPEKDRKKRDWLRHQLFNLEFSMLQKSVWIGANKIPAELLEDLRELKLLQHVHIFHITDKGMIN